MFLGESWPSLCTVGRVDLAWAKTRGRGHSSFQLVLRAAYAAAQLPPPEEIIDDTTVTKDEALAFADQDTYERAHHMICGKRKKRIV